MDDVRHYPIHEQIAAQLYSREAQEAKEPFVFVAVSEEASAIAGANGRRLFLSQGRTVEDVLARMNLRVSEGVTLQAPEKLEDGVTVRLDPAS